MSLRVSTASAPWSAGLEVGRELLVTVLSSGPGPSPHGGARVRLATSGGVLDAVVARSLPGALVPGTAHRVTVARAGPRLELRLLEPPSASTARATPDVEPTSAGVRALVQRAAPRHAEVGRLLAAWGEVWNGLVTGVVPDAGPALAALARDWTGRGVLRALLGTVLSRANATDTEAEPVAQRDPPVDLARRDVDGDAARRAISALRDELASRAAETARWADTTALRELPILLPPDAPLGALRWFVGSADPDAADAAEAGPRRDAFVVVLLLELSALGALRADLHFDVGGTLDVTLGAAEPQGERWLASAASELGERLAGQGLSVRGLCVTRLAASDLPSSGRPAAPRFPGAAGTDAAEGVDLHV
ncbi:MAG: flagellar hook-length control protein FliK [Planctomycetes bacterium]|nr:flagellar hook-length control protein FliK [Planctomycetota bacterium]